MRKTNSKETKKEVRAYLLLCAEAEGINSISEIRGKFINEYGYEISRRGELNACIEWLRGLGLGVDFAYYHIIRLLAGWLDDTVQNQEKRMDKDGDGLYWLLMAREIVASK